MNAIDQYIYNAAPFAQPILNELRETVHHFCPEVKETLKWKCPHFEYKGSLMCHMAAFKQHCAFGFWLAPLMKDEYQIFLREEQAGMGHLGKIRSLEDLPGSDKIGAMILQAMELIDSGAKLSKIRSAPAPQKELNIPEGLIRLLDEHPAAKTVFDNFSYSHKREYVDWLNEAKTDATLNKRLDTTISNLLEGRSKEWKYRK